jgi:ribonucleoside-diphosphate reductase alpha chain
MKKFWQNLILSINTLDAPKDLKSRIDPKSNKGLAKAVAQGKKSGIPGAFIVPCLTRIKENDLSDDISVFNTSWEDEAYLTVSGMNANNTVRLTDDFIHKVLVLDV